MKKLKNFVPQPLNEIFLMKITDIDDIYPRLRARNYEEEVKRYKIEMELYSFLNDFWQKYNIPRRLKEPKKPEKIALPPKRSEEPNWKYATLTPAKPKNKFLRKLGF